MRRQMAVLEVILQNIASGRAQVVTPQPVPVESDKDEGGNDDETPADDVSDLTEDGGDA